MPFNDESDKLSGGDPRELHYYFNGVQIGDISNNGTSNIDYAESIAVHRRTSGTGAFAGGSSVSTFYADFDQSYDALNALNYKPAGSAYTFARATRCSRSRRTSGAMRRCGTCSPTRTGCRARKRWRRGSR
ncbi:MAG TPA: hypothetical protein VF727_16975 [Allosphingosinicella sp.]